MTMTTEDAGHRRRRPTLKDVARRAGVSPATASIVLQGGEGATKRASEQTRLAIAEAADHLGYVPNQSGRGLRVGSPETIALVVKWLESPWTQGLVTDVTSVAAERGYSTVILSSPDWQGYLARGSADAAIVDSATAADLTESDLAPLLKRGIGLAVFSNTLAPEGFDVVRTNERAASFDAISRLIGEGHRRIACLRRGPDPEASTLEGEDSSDRFLAYVDALAAAGLAVDADLVRDIGASREVAYRETLALLALPDPPTAIFAVSDLGAISALWAARSQQVDVPRDIAILGVGNSRETLLTEPPLSSIGPLTRDYRPLAEHLLDRLLLDAPPAVRTFTEEWTVNARGTA